MALPNRLIQSFVLSLILGIALYAVSIVAADLEAVWAAVFRHGISGWLVILGLSVINYALRFIRQQNYLAINKQHNIAYIPKFSAICYGRNQAYS